MAAIRAIPCPEWRGRHRLYSKKSRICESFSHSCSPVGRGFTLIELLVVIGIIALLLSILIPVLSDARRSAQDVRCLSNLRQIGTSFHLYANAHKGMLPAPNALYTSPIRYVPWQVALWQYVYNKKPLPNSALISGRHEYLANTVFVCPSGKIDERTFDYRSMGYSMNEDLPGIPLVTIGPTLPTNEFKRLSGVKTGADVLLAADGVTGSVASNTAGDRDVVVGPSGNEFDVVSQPRHQNRHPKGKVSILLIDGSARMREWIFSKTDIPVPDRLAPRIPTQYPKDVQRFWFGKTL